ncbi:MAG: aspartate kinase [Promethearchaeota archaeon]
MFVELIDEILVMKFGGSCLTGAESFGKILEITKWYQGRGPVLVFVASAFKGVTDELIRMGNLASEVADPARIEEAVTELEKLHTAVVEQIFGDEHEEQVEKVGKFLEEKLSEIEETLAQIQEFGLEPYYLDLLVSYGERLSTFVLATYLESRGEDVIYVQGEEVVITDDNFNNALPLHEFTAKRVREKFVPVMEADPRTIFCVMGYVGRNKIGYTTTLGRGGSDFTATLLARVFSELGVARRVKVVFWKDVDGLLFASPEYCPGAALIEKASYDEAQEMAFFGAKVLHPKCLAVVSHHGVPVEIRNFEKPLDNPRFTFISHESGQQGLKGISTVEDAALISVASGSLVETPGVLGRIFSLMGAHGINVSLVAQSSSEVNTTFVVREQDAEKAMAALANDEFFTGWFEASWQPVAILAIVGREVKSARTKAKVYAALAEEGIDPIAVAQSSDGLNTSLVVARDQLARAVQAIHDQFHSHERPSKPF